MDEKAPKQEITLEKAIELLNKGKMNDEHGRLRWSSNYTFLVSVEDEEQDIKALAIYKPQSGERPLWDFPDGTLCYRETAAYVISEALGWQIVPPTVIREGNRGIGSVQLYINHNPEITYFNLDESFAPQLQRMAVFDAITNNADRKGGHCLLGSNGKIWGIDHGICFHAAPKLRTVIWEYAESSLPDDICTDVQKFIKTSSDTEGKLQKQLKKLISEREIEALIRRTEKLMTTGKFPSPGRGPSYPWPPV